MLWKKIITMVIDFILIVIVVLVVIFALVGTIEAEEIKYNILTGWQTTSDDAAVDYDLDRQAYIWKSPDSKARFNDDKQKFESFNSKPSWIYHLFKGWSFTNKKEMIYTIKDGWHYAE